MPTYPLSVTVATGQSGHAALHNEERGAINDINDRVNDVNGRTAQYVGTGSPESVVTAPVGASYTDTAATNGAVRWIKASGTGTTGWRVAWGDTGWRAITLDSGWTNLNGSITRLRRFGNQVEIRTGFLANSVAKTPFGWITFYTLPLGFYAGNGGPETAWRNAAPGDLAMHVEGDKCALLGTFPNVNDVNCWGTFSWLTTDNWPSSLPGTSTP